MEAQKDFKELLELFNAHNVEYMIVGSYALAFHDAPLNETFTKAIKDRKIKETIEKKKQENGKLSFDTPTVILTDSAKNIINLVEPSDKTYFAWDEPLVFIKLTR